MINRIQIYIIYIFSIYPLVAFLTLKFTDISTANIITVLIILLVPFILITREREEINIPHYLKIYFIFIIVTFTSDISNDKIVNFFEYFYRNTYIKTFLILFIIENTYLRETLIENIRKILWVILFLSLAVILIQYLVDYTFFVRESVIENTRTLFEFRAPSIFSWTGQNIEQGFAIPPIISILVSENYLSGQTKKNYILFMIGIIITVLGKSRWAMVSMFVISLQTLQYSNEKVTKFIKYILSIVLIIIITIQVLAMSGIDVEKIIQNRIFESQRTMKEKSAGTRILAVYMFLEFFPENPIFGTGGVMRDDLVRAIRGRSSQIHVGILSLFYYYGLVGGLIYLFFLFHLFKRLKFVATKTGYWGSFYALLTFPIANLTLVSFDLFKMGLVIAMVFHKFYEQKYLTEENSN